MENHYKMNIEMDLAVEASAESTLSNSLESGITAECSRGDADSKLDECAGWTNEKHNSYLDYLENSFVSQLYSYLGGETQRLTRTRDVKSNSYKSTDQFTVIQKGCRQKVDFGKKLAQLETSSEFCSLKNSLRSNPENSNRNCTMGSAVKGNVLCNEETKNSGDKAFTGTYRNSLGHEYPAQSTAEASGQNFREEEKECDPELTRKREREANNDDSSLKDQVVPVRMVKPKM